MDLRKMTTETRNQNSMNLDTMTSLEIATTMNNEDKRVPLAIEKELPKIAKIIDAVAEAFEGGHRLFYMGAGTSGRLGILDASECPPTFGVEHGQVVGLIAGGERAIQYAVEKAEDSKELGANDLKDHNLCSGDVVVGIAASGRTPYVIGGMEYAKSLGCFVGSISSNKGSEIGQIADAAVETVVGPEVLTGSSRLKSGTAQKMVCNMITTGAMIRTGKSYENLMVNVVQSNEKLRVRAENIVIDATGVERAHARELLDQADGVAKVAIVMAILDCDCDEAKKRLKESGGHTRLAIGKE
ncbi:MAG: N-acetylmuramic acid 6-phosphate etherase [Coriobacteriia bacterium]|nr:N-acetylmuramic acid 6-phosphate etherase [Coriobacteriia bacterium]